MSVAQSDSRFNRHRTAPSSVYGWPKPRRRLAWSAVRPRHQGVAKSHGAREGAVSGVGMEEAGRAASPVAKRCREGRYVEGVESLSVRKRGRSLSMIHAAASVFPHCTSMAGVPDPPIRVEDVTVPIGPQVGRGAGGILSVPIPLLHRGHVIGSRRHAHRPATGDDMR